MSTTSSIPSTSAAAPTPTTSSAASTAAAASLAGLSQSDFLQLLVAQMQYQDPMNPTNATDFMTELANFSTVEGMTQLNSSVSLQNLEQSTNLIGQNVNYSDSNGNPASGVVSSVNIQNGQVQLDINNTAVNLSQLTNIT